MEFDEFMEKAGHLKLDLSGVDPGKILKYWQETAIITAKENNKLKELMREYCKDYKATDKRKLSYIAGHYYDEFKQCLNI